MWSATSRVPKTSLKKLSKLPKKIKETLSNVENASLTNQSDKKAMKRDRVKKEEESSLSNVSEIKSDAEELSKEISQLQNQKNGDTTKLKNIIESMKNKLDSSEKSNNSDNNTDKIENSMKDEGIEELTDNEDE